MRWSQQFTIGIGVNVEWRSSIDVPLVEIVSDFQQASIQSDGDGERIFSVFQYDILLNSVPNHRALHHHWISSSSSMILRHCRWSDEACEQGTAIVWFWDQVFWKRPSYCWHHHKLWSSFYRRCLKRFSWFSSSHDIFPDVCRSAKGVKTSTLEFISMFSSYQCPVIHR